MYSLNDQSPNTCKIIRREALKDNVNFLWRKNVKRFVEFAMRAERMREG